jgi:hypothetical protein
MIRSKTEYFNASTVSSLNITTIRADRTVMWTHSHATAGPQMVRRQSGISRSIYFFEHPFHCWILVFRCNEYEEFDFFVVKPTSADRF